LIRASAEILVASKAAGDLWATEVWSQAVDMIPAFTSIGIGLFSRSPAGSTVPDLPSQVGISAHNLFAIRSITKFRACSLAVIWQ
jgi:hypothetical protein